MPNPPADRDHATAAPPSSTGPDAHRAATGRTPLPGLPPIPEPFAGGMLTMDDGARIHWEASGNPRGVPVVHLHGGPGGGLGRGGYRRDFDPAAHLIIGIDQRGCGRSRPLVSDDPVSLATNTTARLIADLEGVRDQLGVRAWIVHGVSWGSTLALAYALAHPGRVLAAVLVAVTTTSRREVDWITEGVGRIFPEEWERFRSASGVDEGGRVVEAYAARLASTDPSAQAVADRRAAADAWDRWESVHVSLDPWWSPGPVRADPAERLVFCTLVTHYWAHDGFMRGPRWGEPAPVLDRAARLEGIPGLLVHGRRDISGPVETAWRLHRAWPGSELRVVEEEGHGGPLEMGLARDWVAALMDHWEADGVLEDLRHGPGPIGGAAGD